LRREVMLDNFGGRKRTGDEGGKKDPNFLHSETPFYVGR